jgi:hypothetical protein
MPRGDLMIGPGGVAKRPKSESAELTRALDMCEELRVQIQRDNMMQAQSLLSRVEIILSRLRSQVAGGYHENPSSSRMYEPFKIIGPLGRDVHVIAYKHAKDGKNYKHDFQRGSAEILAVERHGKKELLITSPDGVPLWDEF